MTAPWRQITDDLGLRVAPERQPRRIVSLVPSWTETLFALGAGEKVIGVTRFCVEPAEGVAGLPKLGGTKNPNLGELFKLSPDLVIANAEENRREDVERIRERGIAVMTTYPRTVPGAVDSLLKIGRAIGHETEAAAMVREIALVVSGIEAGLGVWSKLRLRAFCPIWKKPWMAFNADTYAHDVLRMMGFNNVYASAGDRYPRITLDEAVERRPDVVLLPDEPYEFGPADVEDLKGTLPQALGRRVMVIAGRDLHWYGVRMITGLPALNQRLARLRAALL